MPKMGTVTIWEKELNPNQSPSPCSGNIFYTRMHSSRMRTICSVSRIPRGGVLPGGCFPGGVLPGGCASLGMLPRGCVVGGGYLPGPGGWDGGIPACTEADTTPC